MALAAIAVIEGVALVLNGLLTLVTAGQSTGPEEISNTSAINLEIVIFLVLGFGLIVTGIGWWRSKRWARAPFVLMQVISLLVGYNFLPSTGANERIAGIVMIACAVVGILLTFLPSTTRALLEAD